MGESAGKLAWGRLSRSVSLDILRLVLRPVLKFALRHSLKLQEIVETCKRVVIELAAGELESSGQPATANKLSIMTGVHRADVLRLQRKADPGAGHQNVISRLIGQWQSAPRFCSRPGHPRTLKFEGKQGEFSDLVSSVSGDLNPYTVLFELERIGAVRRTARGLELLAREHILGEDRKESFRHLSNDGEDLICAVEENVLQLPELPNLHLRTEYDNVSSQHIEKIREWLLKEGSAFHARARKFLSRYDRDINPAMEKQSPPVRVAVGAFSRIEKGKGRQGKE